MTTPVLEIKNLSVNYHPGRGPLRALRDVSMEIQPGRINRRDAKANTANGSNLPLKLRSPRETSS